jgi:predicted Ser/Thr protein kinase
MNSLDLIERAMSNLDQVASGQSFSSLIPFEDYLNLVRQRPEHHLRNVFQQFHDMVRHYVSQGANEYPDDADSIALVEYDCTRLFVKGTDKPYFADRLFANRLVELVKNLKRGMQQNKIYIFDGPPGCGKSTFLNNLLLKYEEYANSAEGLRYEVVWRLDRKLLGDVSLDLTREQAEELHSHPGHISCDIHLPSLSSPLKSREEAAAFLHEQILRSKEPYLDVPCPSHDHPILLIPKAHRKGFMEDLIDKIGFSEVLFCEKEYEWMFKQEPCTICQSLYQAVIDKVESPRAVLNMVYARPYLVKRRMGDGVSVFNPGDASPKQEVMGNERIQEQQDRLFKDAQGVEYVYSRYARTNNGVYALMDIKQHNIERLKELHNIISEGVHKVGNIEERVDSLLLAVMNPEDRDNFGEVPSFSDRIEYVKIPYVLDINTEVEIYKSIFGPKIADSFLPRVLHNFARVIISTRLNPDSKGLKEWLQDPTRYHKYCDKNLHILKMEIYTGNTPDWLSEEDIKNLTPVRRRRIFNEGEKEGRAGFSGRDSIRLFSEFFSIYSKEGKLINIGMLLNFFTKRHKKLSDKIPEGFLDSLVDHYDYNVLQQVKESLYYYNHERISKDIQNYLFALNFEMGTSLVVEYTGERIELSEDYLEAIENKILGQELAPDKRLEFRKDIQQEYTSNTLTREILVEGLALTKTNLYAALLERFLYNLKSKVLDPFVANQNFRRAIKDWGTPDFKSYDVKICNDIKYMMGNLQKKYAYSAKGAQEVLIDIIDRGIVEKFSGY